MLIEPHSINMSYIMEVFDLEIIGRNIAHIQDIYCYICEGFSIPKL